MLMKWFLCWTLAALPLAAQHEAEKAEKKKNPAMGNPEAIAAGKKLYLTSCTACHGPNGQGGRGPNLRQRGMWHPLDDDGLFSTIKKGVPGADMPATNLADDQIWQIAAFVRSLTAPAIETSAPGNVRSGESLFWGKAGCSNCHAILGRGGMLGPDLSTIGATRSIEDLNESIVDPDADGFPRHKAIRATLKDGRVIEGVARNRTNYSVQVQDKSGKLYRLNMTEVRALDISPHSPMPRDFARKLSRQEIDDIVAFLSRQSVRPFESPEKK
jgi:putative heme-binding domain-containing protein